MGQTVTYSLLAILDFNNIRKRMSVIGVEEFLCQLEIRKVDIRYRNQDKKLCRFGNLINCLS